MSSLDDIKKAIRDIPDFPQKGIIFKDITPILGDSALFNATIEMFSERHLESGIDKVAAVDARGFIFGAAVALKLGAGFVPIRKKGKLPYETIERSYELEYGSATLAAHVDAVSAGEKVLIVDDLLATGGTAAASAELVTALGGKIVEFMFLIELGFLSGRDKLKDFPVFSAIIC